MNYFLLAFLVLLVVEIILCTIQKYVYQPNLGEFMFLTNHHTLSQHIFFNYESVNAFYLGKLPDTSVGTVLQDMASFLIIFNYVIPISLYVTLGKCSRFVNSAAVLRK